MNTFFLNILFILTGCFELFAHPVHVSVCNLEFTDKESIVAIKLFSDDFGTVLKNKYHEDIDLSQADEEPYRNYITNYVKSNFKIISKSNKLVKFVYDYSETDKINIWLYFKVDKFNSSKKIKIINTLMLDLYEDQTNLFIINQGGVQNGYRFNIQLTEIDISLK